jgi:uncharacterized protein DUF4231
MPAQTAYRQLLKQDLLELIESLDLPDLQKHVLASRWLDQVLWLEGRADHARGRYYFLRVTTIVGGVVIPALVGLIASGGLIAPGTLAAGAPIPAAVLTFWIPPAIFILSLIVAICAAIEEFFHYGERWRHYRRTAEWLKSEGWQFFELSGRYRRYRSHLEAYPHFTGRVEDVIQRDVDIYMTEVAQEQREDRGGQRGQDQERERVAVPNRLEG